MASTATRPPVAPFSVPGPQSSKWLGRLFSTYQVGKDSIGYTNQLFTQYGPVVSLFAGGGTNLYSPVPNCAGTVFVYGPDLVEQVTTHHEIYYKHPLSGRFYQRRADSPRMSPLKHYGVGLFGVNEADHRQHRKLLMPAFHPQQIESYRQDVIDITQSVLDQWQVGQVCDVATTMKLLTLRVVTKTLFGEDVGEEGGKVGSLLEETFKMLGTPAVSLLPFDIPGLPFHQLINLMTQLDEAMRTFIRQKRQQNSLGHDVLSMLIQARDEDSNMTLSEDEILGHTHVIYAAGHETSANALTWTLFLLSQHPQILSDLMDELDHVLAGSAPSLEQLQQLFLLDAVVKESLRILTPAPWNGRVTSRPTELGGYQLPANTEVFVSIYRTHHMPELYPDPETFNPRRWETLQPTAYEYNPFSAGPRICIGAAFARMEIKIILAMLLQRFRLQLIPTTPIDRQGIIVMMPKQGVPMQIHPQDRQFTQGVGGVRGNIREMVNLPV